MPAWVLKQCFEQNINIFELRHIGGHQRAVIRRLMSAALVTSPTVLAVVRSHFACDTLSGAELEDGPLGVNSEGETMDRILPQSIPSTSPIAGAMTLRWREALFYQIFLVLPCTAGNFFWNPSARPVHMQYFGF